MAELRHPNVVLMMGFSVNPPALVTEYLSRGSLFRILHVESPVLELHWTMVLRMLVDLACGIGFLHAQAPRPIVHSDIKSPNVLVDMSWRCKVADLGLAKLKQQAEGGRQGRNGGGGGRGRGGGGRRGSCQLGLGSPAWCAPEVFTAQELTTKSDVYAFGVIMYELLYRTVPFAAVSSVPPRQQRRW